MCERKGSLRSTTKTSATEVSVAVDGDTGAVAAFTRKRQSIHRSHFRALPHSSRQDVTSYTHPFAKAPANFCERNKEP